MTARKPTEGKRILEQRNNNIGDHEISPRLSAFRDNYHGDENRGAYRQRDQYDGNLAISL